VKPLSARRNASSGAFRSSAGFTLIELAVVVFVVTLILGGILVPLSSQVAQRQISDTQRQLEDIKEAIVGFALANGALPCPDKTASGGTGTENDGIEDVEPIAGACVAIEGNLPWVTLGLGTADAWGNRFRYRVTLGFANRLTPFGLGTVGDLRLCDSAACTGQTLSVATASSNSPIAVIVSHGPNRWGALNVDSNAVALPPGCGAVAGCLAMSDDERANGNPAYVVGGVRTFVSRPPTVAESAVNEFDDIVTWLSPHTLKNRMVAAGRLP
jgi:type II secretory pathway pseudopilin PulG